MNKNAIKNFAIWARNKLIADISYRAGLMGITSEGINPPLPQSTGQTEFFDIGTGMPYAITGEAIVQRKHLVELIHQKEKGSNYQTAYKYVTEEVAYTWFNRMIAIRFMEINDYLPSHVRVLSSVSGKMEPDLVTFPFDAGLEIDDFEQQTIIDLKNDSKVDEVFRLLFIKQCNALNEILPGLFEKTNDYTELLLNLSVTDQDGVVYRLINDIPEEDFDIDRGGQVEIIGWLYQYYNTEPKNEAFAKNGKITKEEIPAVTQLFTPDWIVRYMVENSLGRLWVEGHPNDLLKSKWKYYLEEAEQELEVQAKLEEIYKEYGKLNPEAIHFIDPCMGSGHILVYAFDVLMQIYESVGYSQRDAARNILENNLYGLDIDDRAYQMAYFAVMMKARQYNRRILSSDTACHVYSIQDSNSINRNQLTYFGVGLSELEKNDALNQITGLLDTFRDAKEYGSILNVENYNWDLLRRFVSDINIEGQMTLDAAGLSQTQNKIQRLIDIGQTMARKYEVVVTNPPYMGTSSGDEKIIRYVKDNYPDSKADLFAVFIEKCGEFTISNGLYSMITQQAWMFQPSFTKLRTNLSENRFLNMVHLGARAFDEIAGEVVQTTAFVVLKKRLFQFRTKYIRLVEMAGEAAKEKAFFDKNRHYTSRLETFLKIPNNPIAYWVTDNFASIFEKDSISKWSISDGQTKTGDNDKYIRTNWEVNSLIIGKDKKWALIAKGGPFRRWYGNINYVIDWSEKARKHYREDHVARIAPEYIWFREGVSWNHIGGTLFAARYLPDDTLFETAAPSIFFEDSHKLMYIIGFLNSTISNEILKFINPTLSTNVGDITSQPIIFREEYLEKVETIVHKCIKLSRDDWEKYETAKNYLLCSFFGGDTMGHLISDKYKEWEIECDNRFNQLKANEEELNRIFIDIYGLQDELTPEVEDKDVTVRKADLQRDIKSLISYAVGCMFGRYSLDVDGLAYAGGNWDASKYRTFIPDTDNIIPITDEEYFEDDILGLFCGWLKKVYGTETLEQNLDFIASALGNKGSTSREIIRNYFVNDFFKDHCQTYSVTGSGKRPIYWLFDSGKQNGFKALVYLHRYNTDTIGNLRVDYLHRMQRVYESEIDRMQDTIDHSPNSREVTVATKRKEKLLKQLKECHDYDEKVAHLALARTELDLDDGVKYNYRKVQTGTDGKFYEVLADSKAIMMDEKKYKEFKKN